LGHGKEEGSGDSLKIQQDGCEGDCGDESPAEEQEISLISSCPRNKTGEGTAAQPVGCRGNAFGKASYLRVNEFLDSYPNVIVRRSF
jgi:hypothetical protein